MQIAIFNEQQLSGIASHLGASPTVGANSQRILNNVQSNNIPGLSLTGNEITLPAGNYMVRAHVPAIMVGNVRAILWDFTNNLALVTGQSQWSGVGGQLSVKENVNCYVCGEISPTSTINIGVMLYVGMAPQTPSVGGGFGIPTSDGLPEIYTTVEVIAL